METGQRDFKGIWIPAEIWTLEGLGITEKMLWAEIDSFTKNGSCYAGNDYLAKFLGVKERRLQEVLANLKNAGLIEYVSFNGRQRILKSVHPRGAGKCTPEVQESASIYTNTDNSNTETHVAIATAETAVVSFGKEYVNGILAAIEEAHGSVDGKKQEGRQFAHLLAKKLEKGGVPLEKSADTIRAVIAAASETGNAYIMGQTTSPKALYQNWAKIGVALKSGHKKNTVLEIPSL